MNESFLAIGKEGFYYALAGLYWLFGSYRQSGLVVNAALAAAVVPILHDTTRRLFGREAARVSVVLYAILPGFVIWTSQLLREAAVVFLLALAANATVRLTQRTTPGAYVLLGGSLALLFTVRANVALVAAGALLVGLAVGRARVVAGFSTAMAAVGLVAVLVLAAGIGGTGYELSSRASLADISATRQALAQTAKSGIAPDKDFSTTGEAAGFLPFAMASFAFGPFPWTVNSALQVGGVLEALSLWFFFPSLVRGWRYARGSIGRRRLVLGLPALLLAIALSLLIGNYGTIVRERLQISIFLLPFVAQGWVLRPKGERSPTGIRRPQSAPLASHL